MYCSKSLEILMSIEQDISISILIRCEALRSLKRIISIYDEWEF